MKKYIFHFIFLLIFSKSIYGQGYIDSHRKCSEILKNVHHDDTTFWDMLDKRDSCLVGLKAPGFIVKTLDNELLNSDSLRGQVLFLNFWYIRCQPCIQEIPDLNRLAKKYKNTKIRFISFANDDQNRLKEFLKRTKFDFKTVPVAGEILISTFKLYARWPTSIIIDKNGVIQFIQTGKIKYDETNKLLSDLLN